MLRAALVALFVWFASPVSYSAGIENIPVRRMVIAACDGVIKFDPPPFRKNVNVLDPAADCYFTPPSEDFSLILLPDWWLHLNIKNHDCSGTKQGYRRSSPRSSRNNKTKFVYCSAIGCGGGDNPIRGRLAAILDCYFKAVPKGVGLVQVRYNGLNSEIGSSLPFRVDLILGSGSQRNFNWPAAGSVDS